MGLDKLEWYFSSRNNSTHIMGLPITVKSKLTDLAFLIYVHEITYNINQKIVEEVNIK